LQDALHKSKMDKVVTLNPWDKSRVLSRNPWTNPTNPPFSKSYIKAVGSCDTGTLCLGISNSWWFNNTVKIYKSFPL